MKSGSVSERIWFGRFVCVCVRSVIHLAAKMCYEVDRYSRLVFLI